MSKKFQVGDIVQIMTRDEFTATGHYASEYCAISCYGGIIAEVTGVRIPGCVLEPINIITNFDPDAQGILNIKEYTWRYDSLKPYEEHFAEDGFSNVF